ncbi:hypothetical protein GCM10009775_10290 [Microbacterium aoyamense]|uniref:Polysaccharide chain length determinant N-terminal domain-containing protein n=1 Tax=Microbacterium aoyamense TaxID=344166 RepID=A0ABN2PFB7_9MICO|nr:polysaccharide biosynthesis tyrosine autokinase [Microbacterium aoyamense]
MSLRQILAVLWHRKWTMLAVTLIAVLTAWGYLQIRDVEYESSSVVRLNPIVTNGVVTGEIGGVAVELGADTIMSPVILEPAAASLGESTAALENAIYAEFVEGERAGEMTVSSVGPSASIAQDRASAVVATYQTYVDEQLVAAQATLAQRYSDVLANAQNLQNVVALNPDDRIASANLTTAIATMNGLQTAINDLSVAGSATTVTLAAYPGEDTSPSALIILLLALATGLVVGAAAALIRDQFDNRLRDEREIEPITGAASLGDLAWDRSLSRRAQPLPVAESARTGLSEGLRTLRSTLQVLLPTHSAAIVVTSVEPGDGKSFISANLALAWARGGKRVILVGGDLRRPDLARYYHDAADGEGLAELLQEHESGEGITPDVVESRLNTTRHRRLRILPSGFEPADPADLLAGPALAAIIESLRSLADIVVIDSPPAMGMADAALMATHTDGALLVASIRRTDRARLAQATDGLKANGVVVLGVVANRSRRRLPKTYNSYYLRTAGPRSTSQTAPGAGDTRSAAKKSIMPLIPSFMGRGTKPEETDAAAGPVRRTGGAALSEAVELDDDAAIDSEMDYDEPEASLDDPAVDAADGDDEAPIDDEALFDDYPEDDDEPEFDTEPPVKVREALSKTKGKR